MTLSTVAQKLVLHWGEMGTRWGVNRSVAQIHALLYLSDRPLTAEDIASTLGVARSNVSTSLRELQAWGLIRVSHRMGDRRDHFEALVDLWEMVRRIMAERKRRELDPTLALLKELEAAAEHDDSLGEEAKARLGRLQEFVETFARWYEDIHQLPEPTAMRLMAMGSRVARFLERK